MNTINISNKWEGLKYPDSNLVGLIANNIADKNGYALDIGCSSGRHTKMLQEFGFDAMGIEADLSSYNMAINNGLNVEKITLEHFKKNHPLKIVLAWGITPLGNIKNFKDEIIRLSPKYIICDWRSENNTHIKFEDNQHLGKQEIIIIKSGHTLDKLHYRYHTKEDIHIDGYKMIAFQTITKQSNKETNEWYQAVYQKA